MKGFALTVKNTMVMMFDLNDEGRWFSFYDWIDYLR